MSPRFHRPAPYPRLPGTSLVLLLSALFLLAAASPARCELTQKAIEHFLSLVSVEADQRFFFIPKNISSHEYNFSKRMFAVGGKNNSRFFYSSTDSSVAGTSPTNRYKAVVNSTESGFSLGFRMEDCRRHAFAFGRSSKTVKLRPYTKTIVQGACAPCVLPIPAKADETADSFFISDTFEVVPKWFLSINLEKEKLTLKTRLNNSIQTAVADLGLAREWKSGSAKFSVARHKTNRALSNTRMNFTVEQTFLKRLKFFADAGMYTRGLPTASGPFSDLGDRFVFDHLGGDKDFKRLYSQKFGYYSLGVNVSIPIR